MWVTYLAIGKRFPMSSSKTEVELKPRSCHKHSNTAVKQPAKKLRADSPNRFKFNRVLNIRNKQAPVPHPKHSVELVIKLLFDV